jgi:excisionase family DNA binding protein
MASPHKPLLTPDEAAEWLSVSAETLAQWRSQRRGPPYVKLEGRLVRYRIVELEAYLEERLVNISR